MRERASEEDRDEGTAAWGLVAGIMRAIERYNAEVGLESPEADLEPPARGKARGKALCRRKVKGPDRGGA
jgi:hypothetical protein